jgi:hypothetical protein
MMKSACGVMILSGIDFRHGGGNRKGNERMNELDIVNATETETETDNKIRELLPFEEKPK